MNDDDDIKLTLERLVAKRDRLNEAISALERILAGESTQAGEGTGELLPGGTMSLRSVKPPAIVPGEFFGKSQTEAATAYLKKIGHAVHLDQILDALQAGGVKFEGSDPKKTLYTVLVRATRRFVLVSKNTFGLLEFYPNRAKKEKEK